MTEERTSRASDEPTTATKQRKKRKWDQPAADLVAAAAAAAAAAGLPVLNVGALAGVQFPGTTAYPAAPLPNVVPAPYALPQQLAPSVLQSAAAAIQKLCQAKVPDELIAREVVINDADPSVRYKLTKRQTQDEIQWCTCTVIITRGKYHPPNGQPDGEKPLYLHISAGSQLKDTAERIKAVDLAASMIEEILKQGQMPEATSSHFPSIQSNRQAVHPFSASIFLGFDADPSSNVAARIRGPNDQYINHIMNQTGATVVLRGKDSGNLGNCHTEASQQPLHMHLSSVHLKSLEAAKVLAENLLDTIAAELGASRISSSKVYGAVPPPQQLLAGVHTSGTTSDICVSTGASHSFAPTEVTSPTAAPSVTLQSGAPTYSGIPPPSNLISSQAANGGAFYNGYGDIYPQATPLQQVALTLKHASSSTTQVVPVASTSASMTTSVNASEKLEADKRSQRRKFQELPTADLQNSQQGSKFVKTGIYDFGRMNSSSVAHIMRVQPGSNRILPQDTQPSHLSAYTSMPPPPPPMNMPLPYSSNMPPPPPRSMPPQPPKFPSDEVVRNENRPSTLKEPMTPLRSLDASSAAQPKLWSAQLPSKEPKEEKPSSAAVSDTLLKLMDYGDGDDDEDDDQ